MSWSTCTMLVSGPGGGLGARKRNFRGLIPIRAVQVLSGAPMDFLEHCTQADAERLARRIENYWRGKGAMVECSVERVCRAVSGKQKTIHGVRSNMCDGLPANRSED